MTILDDENTQIRLPLAAHPGNPTAARWIAGNLYEMFMNRPTGVLEKIAPEMFALAINGHVFDTLRTVPPRIHVPASFRPVTRAANRTVTTYRFTDGSQLKVRSALNFASWAVPADAHGLPMVSFLPVGLSHTDTPRPFQFVEQLFEGYNITADSSGLRHDRQRGHTIHIDAYAPKLKHRTFPGGARVARMVLGLINEMHREARRERDRERARAKRAAPTEDSTP